VLGATPVACPLPGHSTELVFASLANRQCNEVETAFRGYKRLVPSAPIGAVVKALSLREFLFVLEVLLVAGTNLQAKELEHNV
jgi:hypothetical protein